VASILCHEYKKDVHLQVWKRTGGNRPGEEIFHIEKMNSLLGKTTFCQVFFKGTENWIFVCDKS
jgi:hypothetical protein